MASRKVGQFIQSFGTPKLTAEEIAIVKAHHEYHEDKELQIVGALPHRAVFVRVVDRIGYNDSVIDCLDYYKDDCFESCFIRNATEAQEVKLIKKWLKNTLPEDELQKFIKEGKL